MIIQLTISLLKQNQKTKLETNKMRTFFVIFIQLIQLFLKSNKILIQLSVSALSALTLL